MGPDPLLHAARRTSHVARSKILQYVYIAYYRRVNAINWQPKALRQLRKIDAHAAEQIRKAVTAELADLSRARNVKALVGHEYGYRLRVGNYRVFFDFDGTVRIVSIEEVKKRNERTY